MALQTCCKPLCAAGRGPWLSWGLSALERLWGQAAKEQCSGWGWGREAPFPAHSMPGRSSEGQPEEGVDTGIKSAPVTKNPQGRVLGLKWG